MITLEKLVAFSKTRGFIYSSSEIYGGMAGIYDYGHYGSILKDNIAKAWKKSMVQDRDDVYALDSSIFMHPKTWIASGHVESFDDPQVDCRNCKTRYRADHILEEFDIDADKAPLNEINAYLDNLRHENKLVCKVCGSRDLTEARRFSLMVKSNMGSPVDELSEENVAYLRAETCQGIYLQYKNVVESLHPKLPFGIAQVGKAFRNEIVARQFAFRTREFEQMEMEYFVRPEEMEECYKSWQETRWQYYLEYGIPESDIRWHKHTKLAHYATEAYDVEYNFKSLNGFKEVEGIHARGNWDLSQHSKFSGVNLEMFDSQKNEKVLPHIMECCSGLGRHVLMFLDNAYTEEEVNGETRIVLKLDKRLSPVKAAVMPLMKKDGLSEKAKEVVAMLRKNIDGIVEYDESGSIGKRYRRQDEIGTPVCITIDYDTLKDDAVTVRDRDTMEQKRVTIQQLLINL